MAATDSRQNDVAEFLAGAPGGKGEDDLVLDRWGRYLLPHPVTGKGQPWTRATTMAKSISDTYALSMWSQRMVAKGMSLRADLVALAGTLEVRADKDQLNKLCEQAKDTAGSKVAANLGTAVHSFTERLDKAPGQGAEVLASIPPAHRDDVAAYAATLEASGLFSLPRLIERTTVVTALQVAGTFDRVYGVAREINAKVGGRAVRLLPGEHVIGDVKTGRDLDYGWQEIVIQLALYAHGENASGVWNPSAKQWEPGVPVREDVGVVVHMPVEREPGDPAVTLYLIDLNAGWAAAALCDQVRTWRKARNLATPMEVADMAVFATGPDAAPAPTVITRPPTWEERFRAVTSRGEASALYQQARSHLGEVGGPAELKRLVSIAQEKLATLVEKAG